MTTNRCLFCRRYIFPWQSFGWRVTAEVTIRWHGACRREAVAR